LLAIAHDAVSHGNNDRAAVLKIAKEIASMHDVAIPRYECSVEYSDHCLSDYLQRGSRYDSDDDCGTVLLHASPRKNGSSLDDLLADLQDDFASDYSDDPTPDWAQIEQAIRAYYRPDAIFLPTDEDGNDHECTEACEACTCERTRREERCAHCRCPIEGTQDSDQPYVYVGIGYSVSDAYSEAKQAFLLGNREFICEDAWQDNPENPGESVHPDLAESDLSEDWIEAMNNNGASDYFDHEIGRLYASHVLDGIDYRRMGQAFAASRMGHGWGLWDIGATLGDELHKACKPYGNSQLMCDEEGDPLDLHS